MSSSADDSVALLRQAAIHRGLCLHLGCGRPGAEALTAELAAGSDMLVHGLALDATACDRARKAVREGGVQGIAQVEVLSGKRLPHVDAIADLIVVDDPAGLEKAGIGETELMRVLASGGVMLVRQGQRWVKTPKLRSESAGQWTHPAHGADGNRVTDETIAFPVGLHWQDGLPINIGHWASNRSWVAARGRVINISMTEAENLGPAAQRSVDKRQWLSARSAANGLPLWKTPLGTMDTKSDLNPLNTAPLATDGDLVLCRNEGGLIAVDAVSGEVVRTYPVSFQPVRLAVTKGLAVVVGWGEVLGRKMWDVDTEQGSSLWDHWTPAADKGAVEAFKVATGERVWQDPVPAQTLLVTGDTVVYLVQGPAPVKNQTLVCRDLATGQERWRVSDSDLGGAPNLFLAGVGEGIAALTRHSKGSENFRTRCDQVLAVSLRDGTKLWQSDENGDAFVLFAQGELWYGGKRYKPATGDVLGASGFAMNRGMCVPPVLIGTVGGAPRGGQWQDLKENEKVQSGGVRGACVQGVAVAEDRMYVAQNWCRCAPAQVPGFLALGSEPTPLEDAFAASRPVIKGSGSHAVTTKKVCWPTLRCDPARSAACDFAVPTQLEQKWLTVAAKSNEHRIAKLWAQDLQSALSAPVTDGATVMVSACNQGEVVALGLSDGKERWRAGAGARIDSPPTLHNGLCLTACHDGWVYAFAAADGAFAWQTRIAPQDRRLVAFGQVESSWPVIGSPLVMDGVAYAVAGRSTEMDGGCALVAFDPLTGATRWGSQLTKGPGRRSDVLRWGDDALCMQNWRIDPVAGEPLKAAKDTSKSHGGNLDGLLDSSWIHVGNRRSGKHIAGNVAGDVLVWGGDTWYGYSTDRNVNGCFAITRDNAEAAEPKKASSIAFTWRWPCAGNRRVTALALAGNALVASGRASADDGEQVKGFLVLLNRESGEVLAEISLPSPAVHHGIALAPNAILVSLDDGSVVCLGGRG